MLVDVWLYLLYCVHGGLQKIFIRFCEILKRTALQLQERKETQQLQLQGKMENLLIQTQKKKIKRKVKRNSRNINKNCWIITKKKLEYEKEMEQKKLKYKKELEEKQLEFQQVLELTSCRNSIENDFFFAEHHLDCDWEIFPLSEEDVTFASYFRRYEDLYKTDCWNWSDSKKICLRLCKLDTSEHTKYVNYILHQKNGDLTFTEAVELLMELFSRKISLFQKVNSSVRRILFFTKDGNLWLEWKEKILPLLQNNVTISDLQS